MSVKTSQAVNQLFDTFLGIPFVSTVVTGPVYSAVVIVLIIVLIALFVFRESDGLFSGGLRVFIWGVLATSVVFMLRERSISNAIEKSAEREGVADVFGSSAVSAVNSGDVILTRAGTTVNDANKPTVTNEQLAAVAASRGLTLVEAIPPVRYAQIPGAPQ